MYKLVLNSVIFYLVFLKYVEGDNRNVIASSQTICKSENECVVIQQCEPYMTFLKTLAKPLKPDIVNFIRTEQCGAQNGIPKVCCSNVIKIQPVTGGAVTATPASTIIPTCNMLSRCIPLTDCSLYMNFVKTLKKPLSHFTVLILRSQQCGFQNSKPLICCSSLPESLDNFKHANSEIRPHRKDDNNAFPSGNFRDLIMQQSSGSDLGVTEISPQDVTNNIQSLGNVKKKNSVIVPEATKINAGGGGGVDRKKILKEKEKAMNIAFSNIFDFTGPYDLWRRKRNNGKGNLLDIEIR